MKPEDLAQLIRLQIEQERRHGISYWCDPDLADALAGWGREGTASAPSAPPNGPAGGPPAPRRPEGAISAPSMRTAPQKQGSAAIPPPLQFAKPPSRLMPARRENPSAAMPAAAGASRPQEPPSASRAPARPVWGPPPEAEGRAADWREQLAAVEQEAKGCRSCTLCETRNSVVFGVGQAGVPLVFVGEAPGADEDRQGFPFVGRAGMLLNKIIEAIGLTRDQVYICNVLKCRPPNNRDPLPEEVIACQEFLVRQLAILKPKVICTLGRHSTHLLAGQIGAMKNHRGQAFDWRGAKVVPTYHPAALLRNPSLKPLVWEDVQKVRSLLDGEAGQ